jgi:hypothetical protein
MALWEMSSKSLRSCAVISKICHALRAFHALRADINGVEFRHALRAEFNGAEAAPSDRVVVRGIAA